MKEKNAKELWFTLGILMVIVAWVLTIFFLAMPKEVFIQSRVANELNLQQYDCANQIRNYLNEK